MGFGRPESITPEIGNRHLMFWPFSCFATELVKWLNGYRQLLEY